MLDLGNIKAKKTQDLYPLGMSCSTKRREHVNYLLMNCVTDATLGKCKKCHGALNKETSYTWKTQGIFHKRPVI